MRVNTPTFLNIKILIIQGENIMKYTKEEIKAMYEYDKMIEGIFLDLDEYRKILKKALKKNKNKKIFFISKNSC